MICRVCLKECDFPLNVCGENNSEIVSALQKHFGGLFETLRHDVTTVICCECWYKVKDFHQFYVSVEQAHKHFKYDFDPDSKMCVSVDNRSDAVDEEYVEQVEQLEVEIQIKEELVDNVWQEDPTFSSEGTGAGAGAGTDVDINPLFETESIVLGVGLHSSTANKLAKDNYAPDDITGDSLEDADTPKMPVAMNTRKRVRNINSTNRTKTPDEQKDKAKNLKLKSISPYDDEIIKKHIPLNCDLCAVTVDSFAEMRNHFRLHHVHLKPYVMCCGRKLGKRFLLVQHAYKHEDPEFFKCSECQKVFSDNYVLRSHILANHAPEEELKHECEHCEKRFSRRYLLELHKPTHIPMNERKFVCEKCPQSKPFASEHLLQIHMNMRHKKATNVCHVCAKEIRDNQAFEKHVRLHFEDSGPRVKCPRPNCDRWLKDEDNLKQHLRRHNDEGKVFTCDECGKFCKNRRALHSHLKYAHSNEVFTCDECHKTFKKAITLKEHMAQHTGESLYKCPFCTRTFNSNANMHSHKKKMHPAEWDIWRKTKRGSSQQLINKTGYDHNDSFVSDTQPYDHDILIHNNFMQ